MRNYRSGNGGHAPGHVRDTFLSAIEAFREWEPETPEPTVEFEVNFEPRKITISKACGLVWNCSDVLPRLAVYELECCGVELSRCTYAAATRALRIEIENSAPAKAA